MARFHVYLEGERIGSSELECGDPAMGVAFGRFIPEPEREAAPLNSLVQGMLSVRTINGVSVSASGGVHLSQSAAVDEMEVSVLGIPGKDYEVLFPQHVAAYAAQFKSS